TRKQKPRSQLSAPTSKVKQMSLINSISQIRAVIGEAIRKEGTFEILKPSLVDVEENLIPSLIGSAQLAEVAGAVDGKKAALKKLIEAAIVWNGYAEGWYSGFYEFSATGVKKQDLKDTTSLFRYQEEAVRKDILQKADKSIETLMLYLEANLADFPLYKGSPEFAQNFAYLISTPTALQRALPEIAKSFRMYNVLRAYMPRVEKKTVRSATGQALFDVLKEKIRQADQLDSYYLELLELCQDYAAAATLLEALPWISVQFSPSGIRILSVFNNLQDEKPISDPQIAWLKGILLQRVDQTKTDLRMYLNGTASATVFPEYFNSELYRTPDSRVWSMPDNCNRKHFRL
ncbi:DUF6712 family protein, partial [Dyadobacter sp.]|uniref:DUF6712 family protein n=1 Tax=Dyadobacter sp. TaxID=1914288 RepID=UPI003F707EFC